jgi:carbon monoxide dehydrogenase subunit G
MASLKVSTNVAAPPAQVWADLANIASHVEWMKDAVSLNFTSSSTQGVGTTFECGTKVGPFRLTDRMEITEWVPNKRMGVRHTGLVTGSGVISLRPTRRLPGRARRTKVTWQEQLKFPWYFGGRFAAIPVVPVLWVVWRGSLRNLSNRFSQ